MGDITRSTFSVVQEYVAQIGPEALSGQELVLTRQILDFVGMPPLQDNNGVLALPINELSHEEHDALKDLTKKFLDLKNNIDKEHTNIIYLREAVINNVPDDSFLEEDYQNFQYMFKNQINTIYSNRQKIIEILNMNVPEGNCGFGNLNDSDKDLVKNLTIENESLVSELDEGIFEYYTDAQGDNGQLISYVIDDFLRLYPEYRQMFSIFSVEDESTQIYKIEDVLYQMFYSITLHNIDGTIIFPDAIRMFNDCLEELFKFKNKLILRLNKEQKFFVN